MLRVLARRHARRASGGDGRVRVWDAETGALQTTLEGRTDSVLSCAFSFDGKRILTTSYDEVQSCACSPDGERGVTAHRGWTARLGRSALMGIHCSAQEINGIISDSTHRAAVAPTARGQTCRVRIGARRRRRWRG
jgi:hypothetical protein